MPKPAENTSCPYCQAEFLEDDTRIICPECGIAHHIDCWESNKACSVYGCDGWNVWEAARDQIAQDKSEILDNPEQSAIQTPPTPKVITTIPLDHYYCIKCGKEISQGRIICGFCRKKQPRYWLENCFGPSILLLGGFIGLILWIFRTVC